MTPTMTRRAMLAMARVAAPRNRSTRVDVIASSMHWTCPYCPRAIMADNPRAVRVWADSHLRWHGGAQAVVQVRSTPTVPAGVADWVRDRLSAER
jgi:hypothetical protein